MMDVPRDGKTLVDMVRQRMSPLTVISDEHAAYKNLKNRVQDHHTICHGEGEYASDELNEIHTNNCQCRIGLLGWWLKKRRGVSKWYLAFYVKSFQFVRNHHHQGLSGRFMATLAMVLD